MPKTPCSEGAVGNQLTIPTLFVASVWSHPLPPQEDGFRWTDCHSPTANPFNGTVLMVLLSITPITLTIRLTIPSPNMSRWMGSKTMITTPAFSSKEVLPIKKTPLGRPTTMCG